MTAEELFDREAVMASADAIGRDALRGVLNVLAETCLEECEQVRAHLETGNHNEVRRLAHGIAGAAGNCSATKLQKLARQVEQSENPNAKQIDALRSAAEESSAWVRSDLARLLNG